MAFTARQLITRSCYLAGLTGRGLETPTDEYISDGLDLLNDFLVMKSADIGLIPYYREEVFNAVADQELYFIRDCVKIDTFTFNIDDVRYSTYEKSRQDYFGTGRVDDISSLPYEWHQERKLNGTELYVYFLPQEDYVFKLWGKFALTKVTLNQDLSAILDDYYIQYLRYGLAEYICEYYNLATPVSVSQRLEEYTQKIRDISPMDFTIKKLGYFGNAAPFNYADANLGRGWRPPY